ncbi:MAG: homocysteine S-methyltransferase family protein [Bacillota bacterium]|nr:homocysteine S-methyltransferase family protein [Bacillota bacterium]
MTQDSFISRLKENILLGDGAMGTMLSEALADVQCPEALNLSHREIVLSVHEAYVAAGSIMIQTNTFGANPIKLSAHGLQDETAAINMAAVRIARRAAGDSRIVAGGLGPTGKLMAPLGPLTLMEAASCFHEQAAALDEAGCDVIIIETMSDIQEARAAIIGAREATDKAIICTMTFDSKGRTLTGSDPEQVATVLEAMGVSALGANCGVGPEVMVDIIRRMRRVTNLPILAQANAGLPVLRSGETVYDMEADEMSAYVSEMVKAGAGIIGGCCGTTPAHLAAFAQAIAPLSPPPVPPVGFTKLAGTRQTVYLGASFPTPVIGENINPTARKTIREAYLTGEHNPIVKEAVRQFEAGASVIDVNAGVPGIDQLIVMPEILEKVQQAVPIPLAIDATDPGVMEAGLQVIRGKALINSANGDQELLEQMTDLAVTYGAALLCLTLDGKGIPERAEGRLAIARRMVETAIARGMRREDILIDPLTLTAGAQQELVMETLRAIKLIQSELGVKTILGVSNISHGLPERKPLNAVFLAMALAAGLDLPIINPCEPVYLQTVAAADVLTGKDQHSRMYMAQAAKKGPGSSGSWPENQRSAAYDQTADTESALKEKIIQGEKEGILPMVTALLNEGWTGLDIIEKVISPALAQVGDGYEDGSCFLPQLLMSAEATQQTFAAIKERLPGVHSEELGTIIMATVKGDIHDIGKNIVCVMMENHGFRVIDLGKDVPAETIVQKANQEKADLIGLSALMTTTMQQMERVAILLKKEGLAIPLLVGGAVLTRAYADSIGAVYAPDAVQAVKKAKALVQ